MELRTFQASDADIILSWIKDEEQFRMWSADRYDKYPAEPSDIVSNYEKANPDTFFPLTMVEDDKVLGHVVVRYPEADEDSIVRFGFVIVDDSVRGRGYGKQLLNLAIDYSRDVLNAEKISLGVFDNNEAAVKCYESVGFSYEEDEPFYFEIMGQEWKCLELVYEV